MCADEDVYGSVHQACVDFTSAGSRGGAGKEGYAYAERSNQRAERLEMLSGEYLGRSHQAGLHAVVKGYEHTEQSHESFPAPYIALQEAVHLSS